MRLIAIAILLALVARASADPATAQAAFKQAEELRKQAKWAEACPLYEASYNADPQLGVLLYLADCHEKVGRTATAWAEFNDAAGLAHAKADSREAVARKRADALAPKLSKLKLVAPTTPIPGLVVRRGAVDITALVGGAIPVDPGDLEVTVSAPGYVDWHQKVTVAPSALAEVQIPALEKVVVTQTQTQPELHEGTIKITTAANAQITLDSQVVGTGSYEGKVKSGGHTLRIAADGMRTYQTEVFVGDREVRAIDVPLEKEAVSMPTTTVVVTAPPDNRPSFELAANVGGGVKVFNEKPLVVNARVEAAFRFGHRVNFGVFVDFGSIDTADKCGMNMPGPMPSTPYDFGQRDQFLKCTYVMPGLQLLVHILPEKRFDPFIGIMPGFRFGFATWKPYYAGIAGTEQSEVFPAIVSGVRAGLNYHPKPGLKGFIVGGYVEASVTIFGDETSEDYHDSPQHFVTFLAGVRTATAF